MATLHKGDDDDDDDDDNNNNSYLDLILKNGASLHHIHLWYGAYLSILVS